MGQISLLIGGLSTQASAIDALSRFGYHIPILEAKCPRRAYGDTGPAVDALILVPDQRNLGDELISMDVIHSGSDWTLLTITNQGYGKRTELQEYPIQRRGGKGVKNIDARKGYVCGTTTVSEEDELLVTTKEGVMIRIPANEVREQGRATQGVRIMNVKAGEEMAAVARIS